MSENEKEPESVIKIGSRKSPLALVQTDIIVKKLKELNPDKTFEIVKISTEGDHVLDKPLSKIGSKALFTKELEEALLTHEVDFAVHSLKDLPTSLPDGLVIGAINKRINPHDVVVLHPDFKEETLQSLREDSVIGTSSLRRIAQLKRQFGHLKFESIRGNLGTRLSKLDDGKTFSGIILAAAGLIRMGKEDRISHVLSPDVCMHAVGQGVLAVECRRNDERILSLISDLVDLETTVCCIAERSLMKTLEGGCSAPVAVSSLYKNSQLKLEGGVYSLDGSEAVVETIVRTLEHEEHDNEDATPAKRMRRDSDAEDDSNVYVGVICNGEVSPDLLKKAADVGKELAEIMIKRGGREILDTLRTSEKK